MNAERGESELAKDHLYDMARSGNIKDPKKIKEIADDLKLVEKDLKKVKPETDVEEEALQSAEKQKLKKVLPK